MAWLRQKGDVCGKVPLVDLTESTSTVTPFSMTLNARVVG
jgi:hypothetical protein